MASARPRYRQAAMTESSVERMIGIFDVQPIGPAPATFAGESDGGGRPVVDGSQILALALVAPAQAAPPGHGRRHRPPLADTQGMVDPIPIRKTTKSPSMSAV